MEPKSKKIMDYLKIDNNTQFEIPEYQRAYSWEIDQCDKLLEDINTYIDSYSKSNKTYFFGTIILDCSPSQKNGKEVKRIIDGQQRTTTFLLLIKALLLQIEVHIDKLKDTKIESGKYTKEDLENKKKIILNILYNVSRSKEISELEDNWDEKVKDRIIIENNSNNELNQQELNYILNSRTFDEIESKVYKRKGAKGDNKYTNFFRNFKHFYNTFDDKSYNDHLLIDFSETFLEQCKIIEIPCESMDDAITMFNSLNSTGLPLSDADIISAKLYGKITKRESFNESWKNLIALTKELNSQGVVNVEAILSEYMHYNLAKEGLTDVKVSSIRTYFNEFIKDEDTASKLCADLFRIALFWVKLNTFPVVKVLLKFNQNFKYFFISYFFSRFSTEEEIKEIDVVEFAEILLRLFLLLEVCPNATYSTSDFKSFLFKKHVDIVKKDIPLEKIKKDFDDQIEFLNNKYNNEDDDNIGQYKKHSIVFLNEYLYCKDNSEPFILDSKTTIEHIVPQSGKEIEIIKKDALLEDCFDDYVNKIGNKILLEENLNIQLGNKWFISKKEGYKASIRSGLVKKIREYKKDTWTKDDIDIHTKKYTERILKFIKGE